MKIGFLSISLFAAILLTACSTPEPSTNGFNTESIRSFEAEDAAVLHSFAVGSDESASGLAYLEQSTGTTAAAFGEVDAAIMFEIEQAGAYTFWARVWASDHNSDALYIGLNDVSRRIFPTLHGEFQWREIGNMELQAGEHRITIARGEPGVRLDVLAITMDERVVPANLDAHLGLESAEVPGTGLKPPSDPSAPTPSTDSGGDTIRGTMSIRGDASFDSAALSKDAKRWYDRLWAAIDNPDPSVDPIEVSKSDDAYSIARTLFLENHARILGLRSTGDLRFLDEIDRAAQNLRRSLSDSWCGGVGSEVTISRYGTMAAKDGYLNFRRRGGSDKSDRSYCRDVADLEETLIHGHIAMLMNAYNVNRDLPSPAGIDYGERADFWLDYLLNHFEAKWRERSDVSFPDMEFIDAKFCHTYNQFNMYYYFVGKTLLDRGDERGHEYLAYARDMTDRMFETPYVAGKQPGGFVNTSTPNGPAVVYSFGAPGRDGSYGATNMEACPTTYVRYAIASQLEMYFEDFYRWDDSIMTKIANGFAYFVMDTDSVSGAKQTFAAGVTGSKTVADIPRTVYRSRLTMYKYASSTMSVLQLWDDSGKISRLSDQIYDILAWDKEEPRRPQLAVGNLVAARVQ